MELKQLEFFVAACDRGSFNKAAECLYTTQPNVSRVISGLEKELGRELFERNSRGIQLTPFGETVREYAENVLKNIGMINRLVPDDAGEKLSVSTYASNFLSRLLIEFYEETEGSCVIEHFQGTVEEVTDNVRRGISEIGVVMLAEKQLTTFGHILEHKRLRFHHLGTRELGLFVGPNHPLYERDSVDFEELSGLKFIRGARDYFSMEHHLDAVSMGVLDSESLNNVIRTGSDYLYVNALLHTDVCGLGVRLHGEKHWIHDVKILSIDGCEPTLAVGYTTADHQEALSAPAEKFIELLRRRM